MPNLFEAQIILKIYSWTQLQLKDVAQVKHSTMHTVGFPARTLMFMFPALPHATMALNS